MKLVKAVIPQRIIFTFANCNMKPRKKEFDELVVSSDSLLFAICHASQKIYMIPKYLNNIIALGSKMTRPLLNSPHNNIINENPAYIPQSNF